MAVRQRGQSWQADVGLKGRRERATFRTEAEARSWEKLALDALRLGKPLPSSEGSPGLGYGSIDALCKIVVATEWGRLNGSQGTILNAQRFVQYVGPALSPAEALTQTQIDDFVTHLIEERQASGSTINRYLSAISKLIKKANGAGVIPRAPNLPWQKEGQHRVRYFEPSEEALILQTMRLWSLHRWDDFFIVLLDTGARPWAELCKIPWRDVVEVPSRGLGFNKTKNGLNRFVPLTTRAWEAIERQRAYGDLGPFTSLYQQEGARIWERIRNHLEGLEDTTWYTCRHTFASRLVQRKVRLERVKDLMGHTNIAMTMRYSHLAPRDLEEAIAVLEPVTQPVTRL